MIYTGKSFTLIPRFHVDHLQYGNQLDHLKKRGIGKKTKRSTKLDRYKIYQQYKV